jgi:hypothetical protein
VGVRGDEPGRDDAIGSVDRLVHAALKPRPDVEDPVAFDDDHAVA